MKRQQTILIWLAGGLALLPLVCRADDNPYKDIIDRNVFDLLPPVAPPDPTTNTPPSDIKLTGIVDIFDKKQAVLLVKGAAGKPDDSYILGEGEREDQVEVLAIDETGGSVKVNNAGVVSTLTFDKDGVSDTSANHAPPAVGNFNNPRVGARMIPPPPARTFRMPQQVSSQPQAQSQAQPFQQSGAIINPFAPQVQSQPQNQNEAISPEVQTILIEKARAEHAQEIQQGTYPPLPPTSMTPSEDSSGQ